MPGVYAVKVKQKNSNKSLKAIANLGYRPTFNQKKILFFKMERHHSYEFDSRYTLLTLV